MRVMTKTLRASMLGVAAATAVCMALADNNPKVSNTNIIDEVAWVVGDEPIYRSEIEEMYQQAQYEGTTFKNSPYCAIPEQIAVEKLYLHQAKVDTVEVPENAVRSTVDQRINYLIANLGSKERVEAQLRRPMSAIREQLYDLYHTQYTIQQVQQNLTKDVKATPADVRKYFSSLPPDSIPMVPLQVEVQVITSNPPVLQSEVDSIKNRLREFTEEVNSGKSDFGTLAFFYSEDPGSARQRGELGFHGRAELAPEFSAVAFNLSDPSKVSRIVQTEFGYHIIQLIEKRGDQINCRHILLRPKVRTEEINYAVNKLDSLQKEIGKGTFTFEEAARYVSDDNDTKNNKGIMMNPSSGSSRFEMQELPAEVARQIEKMQPGDVSKPFVMMDQAKNKEVVAIVKLTNRFPAHKATLSEDFSLLKNLYEQRAKEKILKDWVEKKIKQTYVHIEEGWDGCDFEYQGWIK